MTKYSLHTPESRERDARFVGFEPKGRKMTERVDSETVSDIVSALNAIQAFGQVHDVELSAAAKTLKAFLAERDALEAENQKLRDVVQWVARNGGFAHPHNIISVAKAALVEQEKTDG